MHRPLQKRTSSCVIATACTRIFILTLYPAISKEPKDNGFQKPVVFLFLLKQIIMHDVYNIRHHTTTGGG